MSAPAADDVGLADERSSLAWQRTSLSVATAGAVAARLTFDRLGVVAIILFVGALALSLWLLVESRRRYRRHERRPRGGKATLVLAVATTVLAAVEAIALVA